MKQNNQLKAALILIENVFFNLKKYNRKEFAEILQQNDLSNSKDSITRLLKFIDEIFGIELTFKTKNGRIELIDDTDNRYQMIKSLILQGKLKKDKAFHNSPFISFGSESKFKNIDLVIEILDAITKSVCLKVEYLKYQENNLKSYIIKPNLLKEYLGRWYLIAEKNNNDVRVFGLDRIQNLTLLNQNFKPNFAVRDLFQNTIGVNFSGNGKIEDVVLQVESYQLKLFESYPIHPSQKILERNDKFGKLSIKVLINYELQQLLASYLDKVIVLKPEYLKTAMSNLLAEMHKNYSK